MRVLVCDFHKLEAVMELYESIMRGLEEAIGIKKGNIFLVKKENMPVLTYVASDKERLLPDDDTTSIQNSYV